MKPIAGLNRDISKSLLEEGQVCNARNIMLSKLFKSVTNEEGFSTYGCPLGNGFFINGIIPTNIGYFQFSVNEVSNISDISYVENGVCTCIIRDGALGFNRDHPIRGVYQYNYAGQLIIAFWEGLEDTANVPRLLNKDCPPFELNPDCSLVNPSDIVLLNLFGSVNNARIELDEVVESGGSLVTGIYSIAIAYEFGDESRTNWFEQSNWISVHDDNSKMQFSFIDGAEAGSISNKSIRIKFDNIDTRFSKIAIAVISKIGGVMEAALVARIDINSSTIYWTYNGTQLIQDLDVSEVIVPTTSYDRVHTGTNYQGSLRLANLRKTAAPDIQPYINNITLKWDASKELEISSYEGSYKYPNNVFYFRTFKEFAVYAFFLIVKMTDGTRWSYFIPGRASEAITIDGIGTPVNETTNIENLVIFGATDPDIVIADDADFGGTDYFRIFDTARVDGTLGYWENQDETYPDNDCMDIKNCSGTIINTLRNKKVRHHRMPSLKILNDTFGDILTASGDPLLFRLESSDFDDKSAGIYKFGDAQWSLVNNNISTEGNIISSVNGYNSYTAQFTQVVTISYEFHVSNIDSYFTVKVGILRNGSTNVYLLNHNQDPGIFGGNETYDEVNTDTIELNAGDVLYWECRYTNELPTPGPPPPPLNDEEPNMEPGTFFQVTVDNPESYSTTKRILGIKIENFCIPEQLRENIVGYELGYAERTSIDQVVLDSDVIKYQLNGDLFRSHPFDSLLTKQNPSFDFVRTYYKFEGTTPFIYSQRTLQHELHIIKTVQYVPTDVTIPIDNEKREEVLFGTLVNGFTGVVAGTTGNDAYYLSDFLRVVNNLYLDWRNLPIVRTGNSFEYNDVPTVIYGGDTFWSIYGVFTSTNELNETDTDHNIYRLKNLIRLLYPISSIANIGLRHSDTANFYYPKNADYDNDISSDPLVVPIVNQTTNGLLYNTDYSSVNNLQPQVVVDCYSDCKPQLIRFPHRIHRSIDLGREEYTPGWRIFLTNDYYEMPKNKGEIWKLTTYDLDLMIQHKYALYHARYKDTLLTNSIEVALGNGDLFSTPPREIVPDDGGYIGCVSQWAAFVCPIGYVVIDGSTQGYGRIFVFNGELKDLSKIGLRNFSFEYLFVPDTDNPFVNNAITAAYDSKYNRLIISKYGREFNPDNVHIQGFDSFTISLSIDFMKWVCYHDYIPNVLFSNRNGLFSVKNTTVKGQVYRHNIANRYGFYYNNEDDGTPIPMYIDVPFTRGGEDSKKWVSVFWNTELFNSFKKVLADETITEIMIYTDHQCTGLVAINKSESIVRTAGSIRNVEYSWHYSTLRDLVIDKDALIVGEDGTIFVGNLNTAKPFFEKSKFFSKFVVVRLQYNNVAQRFFSLKDIDVLAAKSNR